MENLKDIIEVNGKSYKKVPVYGSLFVSGKRYLLLSPHPVEGFDDWVKEGNGFYVASTEFEGSADDFALYPLPFHVIAYGSCHIELKPSRQYVRMFDREMASKAEQFMEDDKFDAYYEGFVREHNLTEEKPKEAK